MPGIAVLVVDDDETVRNTLVGLLIDEGYEATGARDGGEALLALLGAERASVVLLDLRMPSISGGQMLRFVLYNPDLQRHAYIVHTATPEAITPAERGMLDHLQVPVVGKPFAIEDVLRLVEEAAHRLSGEDNP
jgi:two-component system nitrogen regulation response regulator NtrX